MNTNTTLIVEFLADIEFFTCFSVSDIQKLADKVQIKNFAFGESIISEEDDSQGMYVIHFGMVRLFKLEKGKEVSQGIRKKGQIFSELAALRTIKTEYSVRASAKVELFFIAREHILNLLTHNPENEEFLTRYIALSSVGGLISQLFQLKRKINRKESEEFIRSIGIKKVKKNTVILEQGSADDQRLYVIRQGSINLLRCEQGTDYPIATLSAGDIFGEATTLFQQAHISTAIADVESVILVIPQAAVRFIINKNPDILPFLENRVQYYQKELERQKKLAECRTKPLIFDFSSRPKAGEKIIKRFQLVEQAEEMDCGAACLAMICKYYNINIALGKLRELTNITSDGATLDSLAHVGDSLGFSTQGVKCSYKVLLGFDLPFIAHWEGYHYLIVYGISRHYVWLADPAAGFRKLNFAEFEKGWSGHCLLFKASENLAYIDASSSPRRRFVRYLKPYKGILLHLFIATLIIGILGLAPPLIAQNFIDEVLVYQNEALLILLIIALFISYVFTQITVLLRSFLSTYLIRNMDFSMMSHFFKATLSLPLAFFSTRQTGDIIARFQENNSIRGFLTETCVSTFLSVLMAVLYLTVLFIYNVKMTLILLAFIFPIMLMTVFISPQIKRYADHAFASKVAAESNLIETINAAETIKGLGIERPMRLKWEKLHADSLNTQFHATRFGSIIDLISQLLISVATVGILWFGATLVLNKQMTPGQLIAFSILMGSVMAPLLALQKIWSEVHDAGVSMERLGDILDMASEQKVADRANKIILPEISANIRYSNVYFRYTNNNKLPYVLENLNFSIHAGELIAIVGQSGSGKTTLAKLLMGLYKPTEGHIFVDDYDLNLVDLEYYRKQAGYVMQDNVLFSGTINENIAMGDPDPDYLRVIDAAKIADAHEFISRFPLAYEQFLGERGAGLSGGQIQRICIARALYRNPGLLIFDEATSALDTQSESNILENLQATLKGKTIIVIAHRLSTIIKADKIMVLYEGSLVEEGRHKELIENQGMYYQLVQQQLSR